MSIEQNSFFVNGDPASTEALSLHDNLAIALANTTGALSTSVRQTFEETINGYVIIGITSEVSSANNGSTVIETPCAIDVTVSSIDEFDTLTELSFLPGKVPTIKVQDPNMALTTLDQFIGLPGVDSRALKLARTLSSMLLDLQFAESDKPFSDICIADLRDSWPEVFSLLYHDPILAFYTREYEIELPNGQSLYVATTDLETPNAYEDILSAPPKVEVDFTDATKFWEYSRDHEGESEITSGVINEVPDLDHTDVRMLYDLKTAMGENVPSAADITRISGIIAAQLPPEHEAVLEFELSRAS